ncbi:hypothetical protein [Vibrio hepatarius]|uniref:hypothetical protein n=1 Tax=Vibrio hepatarius TaxID=171383 RepID=UPI001C081089|nr:hypothetical protein [Vibrio hepatarius]MBU2897738.1 hypothetical protein [Vibrio hepatarius]
MKFRQLALICAMTSPYANALQVCTIGDEYRVLEGEGLHQIRKSNYQTFSEDLTPNNLFGSNPIHQSETKPSLIETEEIFPETSSLLDVGPTSVVTLEAEEAASMLKTIGRSAMGAAKGAIEVLGPVGDAVMVGLWANEVAQSFKNETNTGYDRFATVMSLVDWFGVLRLPEREIDRQILVSRWNKVAAGEHYSFTVHNDIVTQQDKKDKQHWADLSKGQQAMLEDLARGFAADLALKYQQYYQEAVLAQTRLTEALVSAIEEEKYKAIYNKLSLEESGKRVFSSDFSSSCQAEVDALLALYPEQEINNNRPPLIPSKQQASRALANLQHCQQGQLDSALSLLNRVRSGAVEGLDGQSMHRLYQQTLNAKITIVETAALQLEQIKTKLIAEMRSEGHSVIEQLFESGAVESAHHYFTNQADYLAIDEMSRSIFGRQATATELRQKYFVVQEGYRKCTKIGILGGDPNFRGCTQYTWIPAEIEKYDSSKDAVISQMVMPNPEVIKQVFEQSLENLIDSGWNAHQEEHWLEKQILNFSEKQRIILKAEQDKSIVMRWLFDSSQAIDSECGGGNGCAGWSTEYLNKEHLSRNSSLHHIANWYARTKNSGYYVHSKRRKKLESLIPQALESEWQANHIKGFYSYIYPGSFDLDKFAPFISSALKDSNLDVTDLAATLALAKGIVKTHIAEAVNTAEQQNEGWLNQQIGDFHRYISIVHAQNTSTGHYASGEPGATGIFSEPLPAHLLRYMILDQYQNINEEEPSYYYSTNNYAEMSYDTRLHFSIDALFGSNSVIAGDIQQLTQVNSIYTNMPGQNCAIVYSQLKDALMSVSANESLYWLAPVSEWFDSLTRQQFKLFSTIRFAVMKQNELNIGCDLSPNNPEYWR